MSIVWLIMILLTSVMGVMINLIQKKMIWNMQKWMRFECGFNPMSPSHLPFSFQFFLIAILFLIFDIEIALILSYPMEIKMMTNFILIYLFMMILTVGLIYEWVKGKLEWSN